MRLCYPYSHVLYLPMPPITCSNPAGWKHSIHKDIDFSFGLFGAVLSSWLYICPFTIQSKFHAGWYSRAPSNHIRPPSESAGDERELDNAPPDAPDVRDTPNQGKCREGVRSPVRYDLADEIWVRSRIDWSLVHSCQLSPHAPTERRNRPD